jgi:molybdate transport system ATP-binding protein
VSAFAVRVLVERKSDRNEPFRLHAELETADGITVVCGPSGSGKSTLLLSILGAERPREGRIRVAGRTVFDSARDVDLPIRQRHVGMVFQEALLFPHLDALGNVAFALHGSGKNERATEFLDKVGARHLARRSPRDLSGGERQRVALARSLAAEPGALLLDEPFSALDGPAREALGRLLVELQAASGIPFMHVTHDLGEALRIGTHLVLLDAGRVVQTGPPDRVIAQPASIAAARAVGTENLYSGLLLDSFPEAGCSEIDLGGTRVQTASLDLERGTRVTLGVRAEDILLSLEPLELTSARNVLAGTIEELKPHGPSVELRITTPVSFRVIVTPASVRELGLEPGKRVYLLIKAAAFHRLL